MITQLRDYQAKAIHAAKVIYSKGRRRFVIYGPTGSGKTVLAESFIRGAVAKGSKVAFVANRIGLVAQASAHLTRAGIAHGIVQGANTEGTHHPVLVCSIQTIASRGLPAVDMIVIDECHGVPGSKAYRNLMFRYSAVPVIGLSATPFARGMAKRYPELGNEPLFEAIVVSATIRDLIEQGFLVDCDIYAPSSPDLSGVKKKRNAFGEMDYDEIELGKAIDKPTLVGDIVHHWKRMANGKATVCFATNIAHSKHITECFIAAGVAAEHIDCYTEEDERAAIMARVTSGKTTVISNVGILTEGWDFPACSVMILARSTLSLIRWIQMCGRILRPCEGKTRGLILDHSGSAHDLGYPTDDLPLELDDGKPNKSAKNEDEKEEAEPKQCPKCAYIKPPKVHKCPMCGFVPERKCDVVVEDGKLELIAREKMVNAMSADERHGVYAALLGYTVRKGIKPGWAYYKYKQIMGRYPTSTSKTQPGPMVEIVRKWFAHEAIERGANNAKAA